MTDALGKGRDTRAEDDHEPTLALGASEWSPGWPARC